jgi:hypothetical protein
MAKRKEETAVKAPAKKTTAKTTAKTAAKAAAKKTTAKTTAKTAAKAAAKKTTAKSTAKKTTAKTTSKVTPVRKSQAEKTDTKQMLENQMAASCQNMLSSIVSWSMDALMYSNIQLISKKLKMSMEEAAAVLDVNAIELAKLTVVYNAYIKTPAGDRAGILGKYNDRIIK